MRSRYLISPDLDVRSLRLAALGILAFLSSCSSSTGFETDATLPAQSVFISTFQENPREKWLIDGGGTIYTGTRDIKITGTCARGVASVQAFSEQGEIGAVVECDKKQNFTWTYSTTKDETIHLQLKPKTRSGAVQDKGVGLTLVVDTTPPRAPVITTNGGANFHSDTSAVEIVGTTDTNTYRMDQDLADSVFSFSNETDTFAHQYTFNPGESRTISYVAVDFVGNRSDTARIAITYLGDVQILTQGMSGINVKNDAPTLSASGLELVNITSSPFMTALHTPIESQPGANRLSMGLINVASQVGNGEAAE